MNSIDYQKIKKANSTRNEEYGKYVWNESRQELRKVFSKEGLEQLGIDMEVSTTFQKNQIN